MLSIRFLFVLKRHDVGSTIAPLVEFCLPITFHGGWHHNNSSLDHIRIKKTFKIGADLHGLAETHVVPKDTSFILQEEIIEPANSNLLMLEQVLIYVFRQTKALREPVCRIFGVMLEAAFRLMLC